MRQLTLIIFSLCLGIKALAGETIFDQDLAKRMIIHANKLYNPDADIQKIVNRWNLDFTDKSRIGVASEIQWKGENIVAPLALSQDIFNAWSRHPQSITRKKDILDSLKSCVFPKKIFMHPVISEKNSQKLAKEYLNYLSFYPDLKFYKITDNWIFVSSIMFDEHHSDCIFAMEDSKGQVLLLQALELTVDPDYYNF